MRLFRCWRWGLLLAGLSITAALAIRQQATCHLEAYQVKASGSRVVINLNCTTPDGGPLVVTRNRSLTAESSSFRGVSLVGSNQMTLTTGPSCRESVLSFCNSTYGITFVRPWVHDLVLRRVKNSSILCFCPGMTAKFVEGSFSYIDARNVLLALDSVVEMYKSQLTNIKITSDTALHVAGGSMHLDTVTFSNISSLTDDYKHCEDCRVIFLDGTSNKADGSVLLTIVNSIMDNISACGDGGVISSNQGGVVITNSRFSNNAAGVHRNESYGFPSRSGGVLWLKESNATIAGSDFTHNSVDGTGGAINAKLSTVNLSSSMFLNNNATDKGGAINVKDSDMTVRRSKVVSNLANCGGGVAAANSNIVIMDSQLLNNTSNYIGGGAYVSMSTMGSHSTFQVVGSGQIVNNTAGYSSGGVCLYTPGFDLAQVTRAVHDNNAPNCANIGVPPLNLTFSSASPNQDGLVRSISDDGAILIILNVTGYKGVPNEGTAVIADVSSVMSRGELLQLQVVNMSLANGAVYFYLRLPLGSHRVNAAIKVGDVGVPTSEQKSDALSFSLDLVSCNLGQVRGPGSAGVCQLCQTGTYSLEHNDSQCWVCPSGADCPGGAAIVPSAGYWRSTPLSDQVHRCPNPAACWPSNVSESKACSDAVLHQAAEKNAADLVVSSLTNSNASCIDLQCSTGYQGPLCGMCAPGYGSAKLFACQKCLDRNVILGLYFLGGALLLCFISLLCHFTLRDAATYASSQSLLVDQPHVTDLLKALVLYLQYVLIIAALNIEWPVSLTYPLKVLAWVFSSASPQTLSVDCLFSEGGALSAGIKKTLFYLLAPIVMLAALLVVEAVILVLHRSRSARTPGTAGASIVDHFASSTIVVLFFFLPSLARTTFGMFSCVTIDSYNTSHTNAGLGAVGTFWVHDLTQACYVGHHYRWSVGLGVPLLIFLCLVLPGAIFFLAWRSRKATLQGPGFVRHYGFLFRTYKTSCSFWEGVIVLQTISLVAVSIFGHSVGSYYQILLMLISLMIVEAMLVTFKPYAQSAAQQVMECGLLCLLLSVIISLTFLPVGSVQVAVNTSAEYRIGMGAVVAVMNLAFVCFVAYRLLRLVSWHQLCHTAQRTTFKIRDQIVLVCPRLYGMQHMPSRVHSARYTEQTTSLGPNALEMGYSMTLCGSAQQQP